MSISHKPLLDLVLPALNDDTHIRIIKLTHVLHKRTCARMIKVIKMKGVCPELEGAEPLRSCPQRARSNSRCVSGVMLCCDHSSQRC